MKEIFVVLNLDAGEITNQRLSDFNQKFGEVIQHKDFFEGILSEDGVVDINLLDKVIQIKITAYKDVRLVPSKLIEGVLEALESIYISKIFGLNFSYNKDIETSFNVFDTDFQNRFRKVDENVIGAGIKYATQKHGYNFDVILEPNYEEYRNSKYNKYYFQANSGFNSEDLDHEEIVDKLSDIYDGTLELEDSTNLIFLRIDNNDDEITFNSET